MKRLKLCLRCLKNACSQIHLVDKCLIVFMIVLLLQSAYSLFTGSSTGEQITNIDVIVRTSAASIFGYFLSANFIRNTADTKTNKIVQTGKTEPIEIEPDTKQNNLLRNQIGFAQPVSANTMQKGEAAQIESKSAPITEGKLQIISATVIGLFCLIILLLMRNISIFNPDLAESSSVAATVTQFRDFISGCVGFLIGCPTHQTDKK